MKKIFLIILFLCGCAHTQQPKEQEVSFRVPSDSVGISEDGRIFWRHDKYQPSDKVILYKRSVTYNIQIPVYDSRARLISHETIPIKVVFSRAPFITREEYVSFMRDQEEILKEIPDKLAKIVEMRNWHIQGNRRIYSRDYVDVCALYSPSNI